LVVHPKNQQESRHEKKQGQDRFFKFHIFLAMVGFCIFILRLVIRIKELQKVLIAFIIVKVTHPCAISDCLYLIFRFPEGKDFAFAVSSSLA
jgi:hypothetical protein